MIKLRIQGTPEEINRMLRIFESSEKIAILSASPLLPNKGTNRFFRKFVDITLKRN